MRKWPHIAAVISLVLLGACEKDENRFERQGPEISPFVEVDVFRQEAGQPVELSIELRAISGLAELQVVKNGEAYDQVEFPADKLIATYEFYYEVENLPDGATIEFSFELTDQMGEKAEPYSFTVEVGPPFSITPATVSGAAVQAIAGRINRNITLTSDNIYLIDGLVSVEGNSTLTIEPGTTVLMRAFQGTEDSRLAITRGSRLVAEGTKDAPVVFTSSRTLAGDAARADWAGIFLYGRARTNQGAAIFEEGFVYGGTNDSDNSGTLRYVRIEYAGKNDADAIQFYGVGSGTRLSYIQVFQCEDNGIRFKGGAASLKYAVVSEHGAYGLWAEHGWRGRGQFWVFQTSIAATIIPVNFNNQARSVELRNDANDFLLQPATYAQLSNITMIGNGNTDLDGTRRGFRIRRGAMGVIQNIIATNFPDDGVRVEDVPPEKLEDGTMVLANARSFSNRSDFDEQAEDYFLVQPGFNVSDEPVPGISPANFVGSAPSSFDPASFDSWFSSAPYIGAVKNAETDWTADGQWCKNPDGSIR